MKSHLFPSTTASSRTVHPSALGSLVRDLKNLVLARTRNRSRYCVRPSLQARCSALRPLGSNNSRAEFSLFLVRRRNHITQNKKKTEKESLGKLAIQNFIYCLIKINRKARRLRYILKEKYCALATKTNENTKRTQNSTVKLTFYHQKLVIFRLYDTSSCRFVESYKNCKQSFWSTVCKHFNLFNPKKSPAQAQRLTTKNLSLIFPPKFVQMFQVVLIYISVQLQETGTITILSTTRCWTICTWCNLQTRSLRNVRTSKRVRVALNVPFFA